MATVILSEIYLKNNSIIINVYGVFFYKVKKYIVY